MVLTATAVAGAKDPLSIRVSLDASWELDVFGGIRNEVQEAAVTAVRVKSYATAMMGAAQVCRRWGPVSHALVTPFVVYLATTDLRA